MRSMRHAVAPDAPGETPYEVTEDMVKEEIGLMRLGRSPGAVGVTVEIWARWPSSVAESRSLASRRVGVPDSMMPKRAHWNALDELHSIPGVVTQQLYPRILLRLLGGLWWLRLFPWTSGSMVGYLPAQQTMSMVCVSFRLRSDGIKLSTS